MSIDERAARELEHLADTATGDTADVVVYRLALAVELFRRAGLEEAVKRIEAKIDHARTR